MDIMHDTEVGRYARFKADGFVFFMDNGKLRIQIGEEEQHTLSVQATHRLLNLLFDHRSDIIQANVAAKEFGTQQGKHRCKNKSNTSS